MGEFPGPALRPGGVPGVPGIPVMRQPPMFMQLRMTPPLMHDNNVQGHAYVHAQWAAGGLAAGPGHGGRGGHAEEPMRGVHVRLPNYQ